MPRVLPLYPPAVSAEGDGEPAVLRGVVVATVHQTGVHLEHGEHVGVELDRPVRVALSKANLHLVAAAWNKW